MGSVHDERELIEQVIVDLTPKPRTRLFMGVDLGLSFDEAHYVRVKVYEKLKGAFPRLESFMENMDVKESNDLIIGGTIRSLLTAPLRERLNEQTLRGIAGKDFSHMTSHEFRAHVREFMRKHDGRGADHPAEDAVGDDNS